MTTNLSQIPIEELLKKQDLIRAEMCRTNFFYFVQEFWGTIIQDTPVFNWHVEYLCRELEVMGRRLFMYTDAEWTKTKEREKAKYDLLVNISPGSTKSTIMSQMFPAWCWINDPTLRFITASYAQDLANEQADYTRRILKSEKFARYFPNVMIRPDSDNKTNYRIDYYTKSPVTGKRERHSSGQRVSCSCMGKITGIHAHMIIIDDPITPKGADGAVLVQTEKWMKETIYSRMVDKEITAVAMVMQRIHEQDPSGLWIRQAKEEGKRLKHICLPATLTKNVAPAGLAKYYKDGYFDPVRLGVGALKKQEMALGPYGFAGQYMQTPVPAGSGMFQTERFLIADSVDYNDVKETVRYWDKAGSYNTGAYTVGLLMHKLEIEGHPKWVVADIVRGQWEAAEREKVIRQTAERDGTKVKIYIEQEGGSGGKESAQHTVANLAGYTVGIDRPTGTNGEDAKSTRAGPYAGQVNAGNVYLLRALWNSCYIDELRHFPLSKYKDQVDASSGAFNMLFKAKQAGTWGTGRLWQKR